MSLRLAILLALPRSLIYCATMTGFLGQVRALYTTSGGMSARSSIATAHFTDCAHYDRAGTRPPEEKAPEHRIHAPLLAINSEAFTYWPSNFSLVESLINEAQNSPNPSPSWLLTVRGTVHVTQSDFSLLYPQLCSFFLKQVANPRRALDLNINASLEFLSHVMPARIVQINRSYLNERLLESDLSPLDRIPSSQMHKPKDKYLAARLRIDHEWIYRLNPGVARKVKRKVTAKEGRGAETGDEIWLHQKPTLESIEAHLRQTHHSNARKERKDGAVPMEKDATDQDSRRVKDPDVGSTSSSTRRASRPAREAEPGGSSTTTLSPDP